MLFSSNLVFSGSRLRSEVSFRVSTLMHPPSFKGLEGQGVNISSIW